MKLDVVWVLIILARPYIHNFGRSSDIFNKVNFPLLETIPYTIGSFGLPH